MGCLQTGKLATLRLNNDRSFFDTVPSAGCGVWDQSVFHLSNYFCFSELIPFFGLFFAKQLSK